MNFEADKTPEEIRYDLRAALETTDQSKWLRFMLAVISGTIPFLGGAVGGAIGGAAGLWSESEGDHLKKVLAAWCDLQESKIADLSKTLMEVITRLDLADDKVRSRVQSPAYLSLVRKAFRDWSGAESEEKRRLIRNLLINAASTKVTDDEVVRLFLKWIDDYSESHFKVIREVYRNPFSTRAGIWSEIGDVNVRDDSAVADLFKTIIHDLSVGHIIRQSRETDLQGNFVRQRRRQNIKRLTLTSAFDNKKPYLLTNLGRQFVHYTMSEVTTKISGTA